ncbi:uncharacterized protein LOC127088272 isoform X2 [Lathyrus oleraceus]|uniref:uncharacterized protein LOC127088272 isoform X2 n=1 Tax=Pisum sativum TaxID=3888 RepID=UPI0021D21C9A|nr:uncharacterized protein LOC127088272 isoform X2 [Pisum sativum]
MPEKKSKQLTFSQIDAVTVSQRYDPTTVFTVLQELSHYPAWKKFDWDELVKKTSSGISNAREYQMLWRHLAYRYSLHDDFEADDPMDDDSDLDYELEPLPSISAESTPECSACVKVMMASRTLSESTPSSSTIEAPLTVNFPVCHSFRTSREISDPSNLMEQTSITFPVTVQRQTLPTVSSSDALETKGTVGGSMASKRKRKAWSEEEDNQLRAAVQKWGEGNWANMAKGDNFPIKRSATQLSQRWTTLRKKDGSGTSGTVNSGATVTTTNTQYTAEQLATRHSLNLALDMPFKKLTAPGMTDPGRTSMSINNQVQSRNTTQVSTVRSSVPLQRPSQQACGSPVKPTATSDNPVSRCIASSAREIKPANIHSGAQTVSRSNAVPNAASSAREIKPAIIHSGAQTVSRSNAVPNAAISARELKPAITHSGAQTVSRSNGIPNAAISAREIRPANIHSGAQTVSRSNAVPNAAISARESKPAIVHSGAQTVSRSNAVPNAAISARELKPAIVHSGAQTVSRSNAVPNAAISARELKPAIIHSGAQTVSRSNAVPNVSPQFKVSQTKNVAHLVPAGSSMAKTSISAGLHSNQKVHSNVTSVKEQEKRVSDSGSTPKEKVTEKNVVHAVPAGSSLTKTSISAGLPSDQKDKHVTSMKDHEKIVSDPGSTPKEKVKEAGASALITQSQIDNKQNKVGLDLDKAKSTPSMKVLEHKAVPQNPGRCEEQGSVKNSIFIPKPTGNGNSNLNEESQVQNQDKKASSVNGSSNQPSKQE